ncbi:MAG: hypothetical protein ABWY18_02440 [Tardiphaga sp.]
MPGIDMSWPEWAAMPCIRLWSIAGMACGAVFVFADDLRTGGLAAGFSMGIAMPE